MRKTLLFLLVVSLSGCAALNRPEVSVNAISAPDVGNYRTYIFMAADEQQRGLEFDQYVAQVERVLAQKGFVEVGTSQQSSFVVELTTKVGEMQSITSSGVMPQWGQTGYSGSHTYGSVVGNQYQSSTYYTPTYGVTGYTPYSSTVTYYPIGFKLTAWALAPDGSHIRQIWSVTATAGSRNGDLRSAFPQMLRAAAPYIAGDTRGVLTVKVPSN
jgi:hypothetical protein